MTLNFWLAYKNILSKFNNIKRKNSNTNIFQTTVIESKSIQYHK